MNEIGKDDALIKKAVKTSKLIPAFNPIQLIEPVEYKLIAVTNEIKNSPKFVLEVKNNGAENIMVVTSYGILFPSIQSDDNTHRITPNWERADRRKGQHASTVFPGETLKVTMSMMRDNTWEMENNGVV